MVRSAKRCCLLLLFLSPTLARAASKPEVLQRCNQGMTAFAAGNIDQALAEFTEAIRIDPQDPAPRGNRGHVYLARNDFDRAIADFNAALQLDPKNPICHLEALTKCGGTFSTCRGIRHVKNVPPHFVSASKEQLDRLRSMLELFKQGKPYRME